jgi:hypothetical protein
VARLRYTRVDAESEATRLAMEYVSNDPSLSEADLAQVVSSTFAPKSKNSKFPVVWFAVFKFPSRPGVVVDGGELSLHVNIETREVVPWNL